MSEAAAASQASPAPAPRPTPPGGVPALAVVPRGTLVPVEPPSAALSAKVVRAILLAIGAAAAAGLVYVLRFMITPVALAMLTFYVMNPLVNLMENRRVPRGIAVAVCFVAFIGIVVGLAMVLWPSVNTWLQQRPHPGEKSVFELQLATRLDQWEIWGRKTYPQIDWGSVLNEGRHFLESQRKRLMEGLPALFLGVASSAGTFVLAPIISLFVLLDGAAMRRRVVSFVPNRYFETVLLLIYRVDRQIAAYLRGAASESAAVALLLAIALWAAGMPDAILFGCLYGVLNVIPLVGPIIGASAGLLYSLIDPTAPSMGIIGACYGGVYVLDAMLINPLVVGKNLNLHPLTIIVGISVGGGLGGILGMLVSIPAIAIGKAIATTLLDAYRRRRQHRFA